MPEIKPINYKIHLEPDLGSFLFAGCLELLLEAPSAVNEITLNILEIAIWQCRLKQDQDFLDCVFKVDSDKEAVTIYLPREIAGNITIIIDYMGQINDKMAGFYRSSYIHQEDTHYIAVTQFEESDARRAFPCMDHPAKKATFDIEMIIDEHLTAISNGAAAEEKMLPDGKKRVKFEQTPVMSTYLVFFGVGNFEITPDETDPRVRVATLPGTQEYARFGLDFGAKALAYSETYYGIPYPLTKMDLLAIPDFAFGAMENWGAITFRENLLLYYPEITSKSGQERICEVIAHEIAHQWFGNLVTPEDWKYLWLNESFATYFGFGVVDNYYPQWDAWQQFLIGMTASAQERDSLLETFAIEIPGGEHVVINTSTAPIIYNKGGSILRQVHGYIGEDNFQKGLRHYLKSHEYGCAASSHLWESFEAASEQPIAAMMKSWIEQPGFPVVSVKRQKNTLLLQQRRFSYLPNDSEQIWKVPITVTCFPEAGEPRQLTTLMEGAQTEIEIPPDSVAYKVNDRQTGFYRVQYEDTHNLELLGLRISSQALPPEDRWGLQNDLFALFKGGNVTLADFLGFLSHYQKEKSYLPLTGIASNLSQVYLIANDVCREKIATLAGPWYETVLDDFGYEPAADENHTVSILREQLIWDAARYGAEMAADFARQQFSGLMNGAAVHSDLMKCIMQAGALTGDEHVFAWFDRRFQESDVEHERMNILQALGCFRKEALIKKAQQYILDSVPARNKFIPVVAMASNPYAVPFLWEWYRTNLEQIEQQLHPLLYERVIAAIIPVAGIENADAVQRFFNDHLKKTDTAKDVIKLSLERLEINLHMRANL